METGSVYRGMRLRVLFSALILALLCSPGPALRADEDEGEWIRPYPLYLPGCEPTDEAGAKRVVAVRLLRETEEGETFAPFGSVSFHTEEYNTVALKARLLTSGKGDEFGFVNIPAPSEPGAHWHFEAPGAGASHEFCNFGFFDTEEIVLPGGVDRRIRVLDPFGRPLVGAAVSMYLGCPHSPALRCGTTDGQGIALLPNLPVDRNGDIWIEAPGIQFGPHHLPPHKVGQSARTILTDPAQTVRGTVEDDAGKPLPGIIVREPDYPRGPATVTDEQGAFVLHGVAAGRPVCFYWPGSPLDPHPNCIVFDFDGDVPLRIALHRDRPTALTEGEPRHVVDVVAVRSYRYVENGKETDRWFEESRVPVALTRKSDGFTVRGETREGVYRALVPEGRYRVVVGGGFSRFKAGYSEVDLPRVHAEPVRMVLAAEQALVGIDLRALDGAGGPRPEAVEIRIPGRKRKLGHWRNPIRIPLGVPAGIRVGPPDRLLPIVEGYVVLDSPSRNRIRFRLVDKEGRPRAPGSVRVDWEELESEPQEDGSYVLHTWAAGTVRVSFGNLLMGTCEEIEIDLPKDQAGLTDLGVITLLDDYEDRPMRSLTLLDAEGEPLTWDEGVMVLSRDYSWGLEWAGVVLDDDGGIRIPLRPDPVPLRIEGGWFYPFSTAIGADSPSEIRLPPGRIEGEVRGSDGMPLSCDVYVDSARFVFSDGKVRIRGVPAGPHIMIIGAKGHVGEVRRIVLAEGEVRTLSVNLPAR